MRIISQDRAIDLPYERFIISVNMQSQGEIIAWTGNHISDDECIVMAIYSSREKAEKAMEMLHENYKKLCTLKTIACGSGEYIYKLPENELKTIIEDCMRMNIFRFPDDEDVEV